MTTKVVDSAVGLCGGAHRLGQLLDERLLDHGLLVRLERAGARLDPFGLGRQLRLDGGGLRHALRLDRARLGEAGALRRRGLCLGEQAALVGRRGGLDLDALRVRLGT